MRSHHLLLLACTLPQQVLPFAPSWRVRRALLRASDADDIDADEAARIAEMRKRMEGMFSGAEAEAAPAADDAPQTPAERRTPSTAPKPPRLGGRGKPRWTPPKRRAVTKAQDAEPRDTDGADAGHVCSCDEKLRKFLLVLVGCSVNEGERDHAAPGVRAQLDRAFIPVKHMVP